MLSLKGLWDIQGKVFGAREKLAGVTNLGWPQWALEIVK